jgi:hypothetical protein
MNQSANAVHSDGVHTLLPRESMSVGARKLRDIYERKPGAPTWFHA